MISIKLSYTEVINTLRNMYFISSYVYLSSANISKSNQGIHEWKHLHYVWEIQYDQFMRWALGQCVPILVKSKFVLYFYFTLSRFLLRTRSWYQKEFLWAMVSCRRSTFYLHNIRKLFSSIDQIGQHYEIVLISSNSKLFLRRRNEPQFSAVKSCRLLFNST